MMFSQVKVQLSEALSQPSGPNIVSPSQLVQQWVQTGSLDDSVAIEEDSWVSCGSWDKAVKLHDLLASVYGTRVKGDTKVNIHTSPSGSTRQSVKRRATKVVALPLITVTDNELSSIKQELVTYDNGDDILDNVLQEAPELDDENESKDFDTDVAKGKALLEEWNNKVPRIKCHFCDTVFRGRTNLDEHLKSEHKGKGYDCHHCGKITNCRVYRESHIRKTHSEYRCHKCDFVFTEQELNTHKPKCSGKPLVCEICYKMIASKQNLRGHLERMHNSGVVKCKYCDQLFAPNSLPDHLREVHDIWQCKGSNCRFKATSRGELVKHNLEKHTKVKIANSQQESVSPDPPENGSTGGTAVVVEEIKTEPELVMLNCPHCHLLIKESSINRHIEELHGNNPLNFKCEECGKKFAKKPLLDSHRRIVHKKFKCIKCKVVFGDHDEWKLHRPLCKGGKNECPICHKTIKGRPGDLKRHIALRHTEGGKQMCEFCGKKLSSTFINDHLKLMHNIWKCSLPGVQKCSYIGNSKEDWVQHMQEAHDVAEQRLERKLKLVTKKVRTRKEHYKTTQIPRMCEHCGRTFQNLSTMKKHVQNIHMQKKIPCKICQKVLPSRHRLLTHMSHVHSARGPDVDKAKGHMCSVCKTQFPNGKTLAMHTKTIHGFVSTENAHQCDICQKLYYSEFRLRMHKKRFHEQRFHCDYPNCDQNFPVKARLQHHIKVDHENLRYTCSHPNCHKTFKWKSKMKQHEIAEHTDLRPYGCEECGQFFGRYSQLEYHTESKHGHKLHAGYMNAFNPEIGQQTWQRLNTRITHDNQGQKLTSDTAELVKSDGGSTRHGRKRTTPLVPEYHSNMNTVETVVESEQGERVIEIQTTTVNLEADGTITWYH